MYVVVKEISTLLSVMKFGNMTMKRRVQYLDNLVALCPNCHRVKHMGLAGVHGVRGRAMVHMSRVNGCH